MGKTLTDIEVPRGVCNVGVPHLQPQRGILFGPSRDVRRQDGVRICASAYNRSPAGIVDDGFAALRSDIEPHEQGHVAFGVRSVGREKPTVVLLLMLSTHALKGHPEIGAHAQIAIDFQTWDGIVLEPYSTWITHFHVRQSSAPVG